MRPSAARTLFVALTLLVAFPVGIWGAGVVATSVLSASGCAHVNPGGFVSCMADKKDEAPAMALVEALLDKNALDALDAAFKLAPDAIRCLLDKAASVVGAGPVENVRARRAREFLDSHGLSLMRCGRAASRLAHNQESAGSSPAGATILAGICPWGICVADLTDG